MRLKKLAQTIIVSATAALTGGLLLTSPASAAQITAYHNGAEAAFDNNPGDGAASWVWVWNGSKYPYAVVEFQFPSGVRDYHDVHGAWASTSFDVDSDIYRVRACTATSVIPKVNYSCGSWKY
jgi:hypothetical protein